MTKHPLKVLMVVGNCSVPDDSRVWHEALCLRDAGMQVSVISTQGDVIDRERRATVEGIPIYRFRVPAGRSTGGYILENLTVVLMSLWLSLVVLLRHGFDIVHVANPPDTLFVLGVLYRPFGKRLIFDQHDITPELLVAIMGKKGGASRFFYWLSRALEWCSYRLADVVITANRSFAEIAQRRGGCSPERVVVVRNGPNLTIFSPRAPDPALKNGRRFLLGYVGVMGVQDGVQYALYALDQLVNVRGRRDVGMVLIGDGVAAPALRSLSHDLGLDEYVHFTGLIPITEVPRYLSTADIGVSPDPQNGVNEYCTMIKTMEYMALGKPTVAFDLKETRYSAEDAALYAAPNDPVDLATKIERLLDDEALRNRLGASGRRRVEEQLNWEYSKVCLRRAYGLLVPPADSPPSESVENSSVPKAIPVDSV